MSNELYFPLDVGYADDEDFIDAGYQAELVFARVGCMMKARTLDGRISKAQLTRACGGIPATFVRAGVKGLLSTGLLVEDGDHYVMPSYLKRNKSSAEIEAARAMSREGSLLGNHNRWHINDGSAATKGNRPSPKCKLCIDQRLSDPESGGRSGGRSGGDQSGGNGPDPQLQDTDTDTDTDRLIVSAPVLRAVDPPTPEAPKPRARSKPDPSVEEAFDDWYSRYPRKMKRADAFKAWKSLKAKEREAALAAVDAFRKSRENQDPQYTLYPASWLRSRSWEDVNADAPKVITDPDGARLDSRALL